MTDKQAQYRPKFSRIWERYDEAAKDNAVHMREILEQALDALEAAERHIVITERVAGEKLEAAEKRIAEQQRSLDHREFLLLSADQVQREYAEALGCAGDNESILEAIDDMKKRIAELESENAYIRNRHKELDLIIGKNILVMQAAIIEWQGTGDAKNGLAWIYNTLFGPGELPDEAEKDAQAYFDRKCAPLDEELMALHQWFWEQSKAERAVLASVRGE